MEFSFIDNSYIAFKTPYNKQQTTDLNNLTSLIKEYPTKYENLTMSNDTYIVPILLRQYPAKVLKFSDKWINLQGDLVDRPKENKIEVTFAKTPNALIIRGLATVNIASILIVDDQELPATNFNFILDFENKQIVAKYDNYKSQK